MGASDLMWAEQALPIFVADVVRTAETDHPKVLDIGAGDGQHATHMREAGLDVVECDYAKGCDFPLKLYHQITDQLPFDAVWCSHTLEHALDVHQFLIAIYRYLKQGGVLGVTVPPAKHEIVGGHVSLWNAGLLLYRLILAGFDCSQARVGNYGYNISVIVQKTLISPRPILMRDHGDIDRLSRFFPLAFQEGYSGVIPNIRWENPSK